MNNTPTAIKSETQFSVFLANKPGILARVCQCLAAEHVNILAMSMMDATEHGVLRLVVEDPENARRAISMLDLPVSESAVLATTLPNRPGALADVVERLASAHVNVNYAYCTTGAAGGKTLGIFRVSDLAKAHRVLAERKLKRRENMAAVRGNGRLRRK
ncbi:hypothetical protein RAS1_28330 [Phycisphaerae bacterium RAS1]|nr:hypothetical protein RAS1_28330 [Phycisphaerae bacterium RAS1]